MKTKIYFIDKESETIRTGYAKMPKRTTLVETITVEKNGVRKRVDIDNVFYDKAKASNRLWEVRVVNLAEKRGLKARWLNDILLVSSIWDEWFITQNKFSKLELRHKNKEWSRNPNHDHFQRTFNIAQLSEYEFIFDSIVKHDDYRINKHTLNKLEQVFNQLKQKTVPVWRIS